MIMNARSLDALSRRIIAAILACLSAVALSSTASADAVSGQGTWETTLQGRDLDGNATSFEAYYDTALDITWLADANYAGTYMSWADANAWASGLNINGINGWRLPTVTDVGNDGCNFAYTGTDCGYNVNIATGEMAHMYYATLGNLAYFDTAGNPNQPGAGLTNTGPFENLQSASYWSATANVTETDFAWIFYYYLGRQYDGGYKPNNFYAWAVRGGDVATVPVLASIWLFGSGLLGLIGVTRSRQRHADRF
jgi:hypothetical protein